MLRGQKGITLIALVVTIIVLIILAGVSISLLFGQYGMVTKAQEGGKLQANAQEYEKESLANVDEYINTQLPTTTPAE